MNIQNSFFFDKKKREIDRNDKGKMFPPQKNFKGPCMKPHVKIVGLGTTGEKIVKRVLERISKVDDVECSTLDNSEYQNFFRNDVFYNREEILSSKNYNDDAPVLMLLVGAFGGRFASYEIPALARFAKDRGFDVGVIASTPFKFEGRRRGVLSDEALQSISKISDFNLIFHNGEMMRDSSEIVPKTLEQAFAMQDDKMADAVESLVKMVAEKGLIVLDYADIRAVWKMSCKSFAFVCFVRGENETNAEFFARCKKTFSENAGGEVERALIQVYHGPDFTLADYDECMEAICDCFSSDPTVIISDSQNNGNMVSVKILYEN